MLHSLAVVHFKRALNSGEAHPRKYESSGVLDLRQTNLMGADSREGYFLKARFDGSDLISARLTGADLPKVYLPTWIREITTAYDLLLLSGSPFWPAPREVDH
jgi:hypothetical protein